MRILNGLSVPWLQADAFVTRVGSDPGDEAGTVLDYLVASEDILQSMETVRVGLDLHFSDHRPVRFGWRGYETGVPETSLVLTAENGPIGWQFKGNPSVSQKKIAQEYLTKDNRLTAIPSVVDTSGAEIAFNLYTIFPKRLLF